MNIEQLDFYTQAILSMAALVGLTSFLMLGEIATADFCVCDAGFFINLDHGIVSIQPE
jgi:hypothetical protein